MNYGTNGSRKVAIIGCGYVGASIAYALTIKDLPREIVLIDCNLEKARSEALDIQHGILEMGMVNIYVGGYKDIKNCDIIIVTAGKNRKPGESRNDLAVDNLNISKSICDEIKKYYIGSIIIVVSNPVDVLTYAYTKWLDVPSGVVVGTGCLLDTSRLVSFIAEYVKINTTVIQTSVIGEHGKNSIPIWSKTSIAGIPIASFCKANNLRWDEELKRAFESLLVNAGMNIIEGKGRTHYGIATCVCSLTDAILNRKPTIFNVSSVLNGVYGVNDIALSVPTIISRRGAKLQIEEALNEDERRKFIDASECMDELLRTLELK